MGRQVNKLTARGVATLTAPGRHSDGGGLYLWVDASGAKRWLFMFRWGSGRKEMGLGGLDAVTLAEARDKAAAARKLIDAGSDPIQARKDAIAATEAGLHATPTFGEFAETLIEDIKAGFRNAKHQAQWSSSLKTHAASLWPLRIDKVGTEQVLDVLKPIWKAKAETASRVRGRIERVLDAAKAKGKRTGENPARWRGHLDKLLPKRSRLARGHHAAMAYDDVPAFVQSLRERDATAARALEFLILTASRTGEIRGAKWDEIDFDRGVWTVPADRMKAGRVHRVPLVGRSLNIARSLQQSSTSEFVFAGARKGRPLSSHAILMLMRRMQMEQFTPHGFRSSFRDWCGEQTAFPREIAEAALAHVVGDETERAYRRGDALEKRRKIMDAWARFVGTPKAKGNNITPIRANTAG
nr:site-specific integrase [Bosea sp. 124]